mmetsp:Transcript_15345/g.22979  ORF Transcript_15345/g.22979 Transcript_15345/m.22979 type:complete len:97 (-) Transcript_15345:798-1088(-)
MACMDFFLIVFENLPAVRLFFFLAKFSKGCNITHNALYLPSDPLALRWPSPGNVLIVNRSIGENEWDLTLLPLFFREDQEAKILFQIVLEIFLQGG